VKEKTWWCKNTTVSARCRVCHKLWDQRKRKWIHVSLKAGRWWSMRSTSQSIFVYGSISFVYDVAATSTANATAFILDSIVQKTQQ